MTGLRSTLAPYAHLSREPDPHAAREAARQAWQNAGLILINPAWLGEWDRQQALILAEKLHGKRRVRQ